MFTALLFGIGQGWPRITSPSTISGVSKLDFSICPACGSHPCPLTHASPDRLLYSPRLSLRGGGRGGGRTVRTCGHFGAAVPSSPLFPPESHTVCLQVWVPRQRAGSPAACRGHKGWSREAGLKTGGQLRRDLFLMCAALLRAPSATGITPVFPANFPHPLVLRLVRDISSCCAEVGERAAGVGLVGESQQWQPTGKGNRTRAKLGDTGSGKEGFRSKLA